MLREAIDKDIVKIKEKIIIDKKEYSFYSNLMYLDNYFYFFEFRNEYDEPVVQLSCMSATISGLIVDLQIKIPSVLCSKNVTGEKLKQVVQRNDLMILLLKVFIEEE
ncbi:MAG: hypothetical protein ACRCSY_06155 [Cetobacterium sp.]